LPRRLRREAPGKLETRNSKFEGFGARGARSGGVPLRHPHSLQPRFRLFEFRISNFEFPPWFLGWLALCCWVGLPLHAQTDASQKLEFHGIQIDKDQRTVTFPAAINMKDGMLEYLIVSDKGKTHESLLSTKIDPYDIQVAMLLLGIKPAEKADSEPPGQITKGYLSSAPELKGEKISLFLSWPGHRVRAEGLIWNLDKNAAMTDGPWTYNGSEMYAGRFLAEVDGSIAALVRDSGALVNNPRPGNDDDQIWEVYSKATPPVGTPVDVTIKLEDNALK